MYFLLKHVDGVALERIVRIDPRPSIFVKSIRADTE